MDKRYDDLRKAMGELAAARDERLRKTGAALPPERLERLHVALAAAFPVETALERVANKRDKACAASPVLPTPRELSLQHHLGRRLTAPTQRPALARSTASLQTLLESVLNPMRMAAALALLLLVVGALRFGRDADTDRSARISQPALHSPSATQRRREPAYQDRLDSGLLRRSAEELTLRVSTIDLASSHPSLLTINGALLGDRHGSDHGLPLDLPIRQILSDANAVAIP